MIDRVLGQQYCVEIMAVTEVSKEARRRRNGRVRGIARMMPKSRVPTDDPAAALAFCRQLVRFLEDGDHPGVDAPVGGIGAVVAAEEGETLRPEFSVVIPVYNEQENLPA